MFTFTTTKDGKVIISFQGRVVTTVTGGKAQRFIDKLATVSPNKIQLMLARLTGNFKRGNEREGN